MQRRWRFAAVVAALSLGCALPVLPADAAPFSPSGQRISGASEAGSAISLRPGNYTDTLARGSESTVEPGSSRFYAITVARGETPYVAATIGGPAEYDSSDTLSVGVSFTPIGDSSACKADTASEYNGGTVTVSVTPGVIGAGDTGCPPGTLIVQVARAGLVAQSDPLPVEMSYRLEPAASGTSRLPGAAGTAQPSPQVTLLGQAAQLASGHSYNGAPLVGDGIYRDTLRGGDFNVVRVHLDWGQRFAYVVSIAGSGGSGDTIGVQAGIRDPLRRPAAQPGGSSTTAYNVGNDDETLSGATLVPVRYKNRTSKDVDVQGYAIAGDYYLAIASEAAASGKSVDLSYSLRIQVFGDPDGAPDYSAPASGTAEQASADGGHATPIVVVLAVAAALLVVIAATSFRTGRRRRHT